ncbi:MAG TPA: hypothetical protein VF755_17295, partial [Catenuloplanes sp.]
DHRSDPGPGDLRPGVGPSDPRLDPGVRPDPGLRGPGTGGSGFPGAPVPEREPMPTRDQARGIDQETTVPLRRPAEPLAVPSSEQAAKRLAAMLRANPSLLHNTPPD